MSVIDRFVVQLGLDARGFSDEAKQSVEQMRKIEQQADKTGAGFEGTGKKGADAFSAVRREALAMFAVFTAGKSLKGFISDTVQANAHLATMAQRLDIDPGKLTRLETAAKAAGGSFGEMAQTFGALQEKMSDPQQRANISRTFAMMGVPDFQNGKGGIDPDIIKKLHQRYIEHPQNKQAMIGYMHDLGFGEGAINQVVMPDDQFKKLQYQIDSMIVLNEAATKSAQELSQIMIVLRKQSEQLTETFTSKLNPELSKAVDNLLKLEKAHPDVAGGLGVIKLAVDELGKSFGGLGNLLAGYVGLKALKGLFRIAKGGVGLAGRLYGGVAEGGAALAGGEGMAAALEAAGIASATALGAVLSGALVAVLPAVLTTAAIAAVAYYMSKSHGGKPGAINELSAYDTPQAAYENITGSNLNKAYHVYKILRKGDLTAEQAAGFIANLNVEDPSFDPQKVGDHGTAIGIGQWHRPRQLDFERLYGHSMKTATLDEEANFLVWESKHTYKKAGDVIRSMKTAPGSAAAASSLYFRPGDEKGEMDRRSKAAEYWMSRFKEREKYGDNGFSGWGHDLIGRMKGSFSSDATQKPPAQSEVARMAASVDAGTSPGAASNTTNTTTNNTTNTGPITINTSATDARGIARDIHGALKQRLTPVHAMGVQ